MKKFFNYSLQTAAFCFTAVAFAGLTACDQEDNPAEPVAEARTYTVSIPANIGGGETRAVTFGADGETITSKFQTTDKINVWWHNGTNWQPLGTLSPNAEGKSAILTGELNLPTSGFESGASLKLLYKMNGNPYFIYHAPASTPSISMNGSASSASDKGFATATVTVSGITGNVLTTSAATFENVGSMFRLRLTFTDGTSTITPRPTISNLTIFLNNGSDVPIIVYNPLDGSKNTAPIVLGNNSDPFQITSDGDVYFAMRLRDDITVSSIKFTATDSENNTYSCTKAAPSADGFQNGRYYYGTATLVKQP